MSGEQKPPSISQSETKMQPAPGEAEEKFKARKELVERQIAWHLWRASEVEPKFCFVESKEYPLSPAMVLIGPKTKPPFQVKRCPKAAVFCSDLDAAKHLFATAFEDDHGNAFGEVPTCEFSCKNRDGAVTLHVNFGFGKFANKDGTCGYISSGVD